MGWIRINLDSVLAYGNRDRVEAAFSMTGRTEAAGWFETVRDSIVARIRAKVGQRSTLDAKPDTIPPEFGELAALLCLSQVLSRIGQVGTTAEGSVFTLTSEQRDRIRKLEDDLSAVAKGDLSVTVPDYPDDEPDVPSGPAVELCGTPATRVLSRSATSGL